MSAQEPYLSCPSAQPDMEDARVFGILEGTVEEPRLSYLKRDAVISDEMMASLGEIDPTHVFRFAAKCESSRCGQFENGKCGLARRVAEALPAVVDALPSCQIRDTCRWYAEIGAASCHRCPQVTTLVPETQNPLRRVAQPDAVMPP
jgi:hypothetical protein